MGFRMNLKWVGGGISVQSPLSSSWPSSFSCKGTDLLARSSSITPVVYGETEMLTDTLKPHAACSSSSPQILENCYLESGDIKMARGKDSDKDLYALLGDDISMSKKENKLGYVTSLQATQASQFQLLMKNLDILEGMFVGSDVVRLESDILKQLERLGALSLFSSCLSKTVNSSNTSSMSNTVATIAKEPKVNDSVDKVFIQSGKKELRRMRRKLLEKGKGSSTPIMPLESISRRKPSKSSSKRSKIVRNEAEMATGVKLIADLEKMKMMLEEGTGQVASLGSWAAVAGIEKKMLQRHLHYGWHCRDELLRSTRSLVLFIARNYCGFGISFEDLIQAGNMGVLQGAERFDQSRGYKFSTYVQYWIRKSMLTLVARHARGVRIPVTLSKAINQVHKARKALTTSHGKYPDDTEIAKFTGLSLAKITSASKCLRVVGSIDQKIGELINIKYLEVTPDLSVMSPDEYVTKQHMIYNLYTLLDSLEPREKQVLILRFGLWNYQCKTLEEIGKLLGVSKEWIRKIERTALTKLRKQDSLEILSNYVNMH